MDKKNQNVGIIRKLDKLGRIVIPIEMRNLLEIKYKTPLEIFVEKDRIIFKKYVPMCIFCGSVDKLVEYKNRLICQNCIEKFKK